MRLFRSLIPPSPVSSPGLAGIFLPIAGWGEREFDLAQCRRAPTLRTIIMFGPRGAPPRNRCRDRLLSGQDQPFNAGIQFFIAGSAPRFLGERSLTVSIAPPEPLSEVAFVLDYIQLAFQNEGFNFYNDIEVRRGTDRFVKGLPGFCDVLVGLMGLRVHQAVACESQLRMAFDDGTILRTLPLASTQSWPEAWQFNSPGRPVVVGRNFG